MHRWNHLKRGLPGRVTRIWNISILHAAVNNVLETLQALGSPIEHCFFFPLVFYMSLPRRGYTTHEAWELKLRNATDPLKFARLNAFLESRIRAFENDNKRSPVPKFPAAAGKPQHNQSPASAYTATPRRASGRTTSCSCCGDAHSIALRPQHRAKTPEQRRDVARDKETVVATKLDIVAGTAACE